MVQFLGLAVGEVRGRFDGLGEVPGEFRDAARQLGGPAGSLPVQPVVFQVFEQGLVEGPGGALVEAVEPEFAGGGSQREAGGGGAGCEEGVVEVGPHVDGSFGLARLFDREVDAVVVEGGSGGRNAPG